MGNARAVNVTRESLEEVTTGLGMGQGFDVGLEMSGIPTAFEQILDATKNGANIALLGLLPEQAGINWSQVIFKGITLRGIYGREMYRTWHRMQSFLQSGLEIAPVITHQMSIDDYLEGFELMVSGQCGKVILNWE